MAGRTAVDHVGFLLPHLRPGMRVLDCGCGPGAIPLDLLQYVAPGKVVGCDVEPIVIEAARKRATELGRKDVTFEVASAYELPFAAESFDVIIMAALLGNLREPEVALREAFRVLKPGGVIALKDFDHGGDLFYPDDTSFKRILELYERYRKHNGHDPYSGRKSHARLVAAGFERARVDARYSTMADAELKAILKDFVALVHEAWTEPLVSLGWVDRKTIETLAADLLQNPPDFVADCWCEAIAFKPGS